MAWNPSPDVAVARDAAKHFKADRVVVLYTTNDGKIGYASYGETRALCANAKGLGDVAFAAVLEELKKQRGRLPF